jgi:bifunctional DNA-binding transcriptional regulator/antitoxin component of YhaV-PrlF toxin-antitoxin module
MRKEFRETVRIREKGQMTIPAEFRERSPWLREETVVDVVLKPAEEKVELYPFRSLQNRKAASRKEIAALWRKMRRLGQCGQEGGLSEFVLKDRKHGHSFG